MHAPLHAARAALVLLVLLVPAPAVRAQNDRDAEGLLVALGLIQRGLQDEAARHLEAFLPSSRGARAAWPSTGSAPR